MPNTDIRGTNRCQQCGGPVRITRPSKSGRHFCSTPECQRERVRLVAIDRRQAQKEERERALAAAGGPALEEAKIARNEVATYLELLKEALTNRLREEAGEEVANFRCPCPECGLENGILKLVHPSQDGTACDRLSVTKNFTAKWSAMLTAQIVVWLYGSKAERVYREV